jgi:hypothetical protein
MPVYFNDALDDTLLYDRQASFIGGQVSNFRENLLNESQAELIKDLALLRSTGYSRLAEASTDLPTF